MQKENEKAWASMSLNEAGSEKNATVASDVPVASSAIVATSTTKSALQQDDDSASYEKITHRKKSEGSAVSAADVDVETFQEKEQREKEVEAAKKSINKPPPPKQQQPAKHSLKQMDDGLIHREDGRRFFPNGVEVSGANSLAQSEQRTHAEGKLSHKHK